MIALPLTFEEAFEGKTANVTVSRERLCRTCGGTGARDPENMPVVRERKARRQHQKKLSFTRVATEFSAFPRCSLGADQTEVPHMFLAMSMETPTVEWRPQQRPPPPADQTSTTRPQTPLNET